MSNVAISGWGKACSFFLASLRFPSRSLWLFFFARPFVSPAEKLWDVDKFLDSRNNREPETESLCRVVAAYTTVHSG